MRIPNKKLILTLLGTGLTVAAASSALAQTPTLMAYWDFNDDSDPTVTLDKIYGFEGVLEENAVYVADGHTGKAIDFGAQAGQNDVLVSDASALNVAAANDQITIAFWQNLHTIASSSAFWGLSPSSSAGMRGIQAHTPWGNNNIYFDTAGCCDGGTQRSSKNVINDFPDFGEGWHHLVFIKNGSTKQVWVDGTLFLEGQNTAPLPTDFIALVIGRNAGDGGSLQGIIDDFAVYAGVLDETQIGQLASGTAPDQISGVDIPSGPLVGIPEGGIYGFTITLTESPTLTVDQDSIEAWLDGNTVTPQISKDGNVTTIAYEDLATRLESESVHEITLDFKDADGNTYHEVRNFTVPTYILVTAAIPSAVSSVFISSFRNRSPTDGSAWSKGIR